MKPASSSLCLGPPVGWLSISGVPLEGDRVTQFAFLDDAGVTAQAKRFVVAGVVLHRDRHSAAVESRLFEIASKARPDKPNVVLHASNLWHGKKDFENLAEPFRRGIVKEIAELARQFGLPVVFGQCLKAGLPRPPIADADDREIVEAMPHVSAQFDCSMRIEDWMRRNAPDELAQLVHEDIPRSKKTLKRFHNYARDPVVGKHFSPQGARPGITPFVKISGPIYYADKYEERLLQLADTCAFAIARHLAGNADIIEVFEALRPQIVDWVDAEGPHA